MPFGIREGNTMRPVLTILCVVGLSGMPSWAKNPPPVERVEVRHGKVYVNGEPFFLVGTSHVAHNHYSLPEAAEMGFNAVVTHGLRENPQSFRMDIDDAYANGLYSLASLSNGIWKDLETTEQIVLACRDAPGLLVWELEDESNIRTAGPEGTPHLDLPYKMPPEDFKPVYDLIKRLDPEHPVWLNLAYGYEKDHRKYRDVADIHSDDVYPVPDYPLTHVAQNSEAVVKGAAGKPGWMYIQMSMQSADQERAPNMEEVRCMTYLSIAHGIVGVIHFAYHALDWWPRESEPAYYAQFLDLTAELRGLTPYLVAREEPVAVEAEIFEGSPAPSHFGYTALHLSLRKAERGYLLIAVNGFDSPVEARIRVPVEGIAPRAAVRSEYRLVDVTDGVIEDSFAPYAVHLYDLPFSPPDDFERRKVSWPQWQRRPRP